MKQTGNQVAGLEGKALLVVVAITGAVQHRFGHQVFAGVTCDRLSALRRSEKESLGGNAAEL